MMKAAEGEKELGRCGRSCGRGERVHLDQRVRGAADAGATTRAGQKPMSRLTENAKYAPSMYMLAWAK